MIELTFRKELTLIRQANQMSAIFDNIRFLNKGFKFEPNVRNRYHDLLMMSMNLNDIASLNIKSADYRCYYYRS